MSLLSIQNLSKNFGGLQAVDKFNLELNEGEIVSLIGPNGAGKTTIFNLLTGVYPTDEGKIIFQSESIKNLKPYDVCKKGIGRTFQVVKPFLNRTVLYNVTVGALLKSTNITEAECEARDILEFSGLINKKDMLAKSLTIADRKRLEIARALATKPKLLLLDETMAGLTPTETEMAINLIRKISKEKNLTIFLIEHVNYGKKIAEDSPLNISKDEKVIKAYLGEEYVVTT